MWAKTTAAADKREAEADKQGAITARAEAEKLLRDAKGQLVHPGYLPGAEQGRGGFGGWEAWITGPEPGNGAMSYFAIGYFSNMVFEKTDWDVNLALHTPTQQPAAAQDAQPRRLN